MFHKFRDTFWMAVGLSKSLKKTQKKRILQNFFTGRASPLNESETQEQIGIMRSPEVQKEFCDYLIHTSK